MDSSSAKTAISHASAGPRLRAVLKNALQRSDEARFDDACEALESIARSSPRAASFHNCALPLLRLGGEALSRNIRCVDAILSLLHRSDLRQDIAGHACEARWMEWALEATDAARWTVGRMFRRHAELEPARKLLIYPTLSRVREFTWAEVESRVSELASGLHAFLRRPGEGWSEAGTGPVQVALLSENRLELALLDLACLTTGIPNVVIPHQMIPEHVSHVLEETKPALLIASTPALLDPIDSLRERFPFLKTIVVMQGKDPRAMSLEEMISAGRERDREDTLDWESRVSPRDLATVMYTSGTTGQPRGVAFTHRNLVSKRIARALALPDTGSQDRFLCYLPLAHTFGRWLELLGCVFLRATYVFLLNPSAERLVQAMRRFRPTVFISVPQKWIQIHELTTAQVRPGPPHAVVDQLLRELTGGKLRFGLSAAGFLDPEIFRFFQSHGVDLASGFGMTEATGGITMTPPGDYREGTVGKPLPGIELRIAEDGELLLRGPYVARAFDPEGGEQKDPEVEWFPTGDLVRLDASGHYAIIGRKKDLIKNLKGETIAPQRVEQLLMALPEVEQAVLLGDARPFNVALLALRRDQKPIRGKSPAQIRRHVSNLVASVNTFLAPYERIVDFAVLPRALSLEKGELTAKGTPRRKTIEETFAHIVEDLYRRAGWVGYVGGVEVRVPEWMFRRTGKTLGDLVGSARGLRWRGERSTLSIRREEERAGRQVRIGSLIYTWPTADGPLNLELLFRTPALWLGNVQLAAFFQNTLSRMPRARNVSHALPEVVGPVRPGPRKKVLEQWKGESTSPSRGLERLHRIVASAHWLREADAADGVRLLAGDLAAPAPGRSLLAHRLLRRLLSDSRRRIAREALLHLLPRESENDLVTTLRLYVDRHPGSTTVEFYRRLTREVFSPAQLRRMSRLAYTEISRPNRSSALGSWLLGFFAALGEQRPAVYPHFRHALAAWALLTPEPHASLALDLIVTLQERYRRDLAGRVPPVSPERVHIDPSLPGPLRRRVTLALTETICAAEAAEILSGGALSPTRMDEAEIRAEPSREADAVRVTVDLPGAPPFAFLIHSYAESEAEAVKEEMLWRLLLSLPGPRGPLSFAVGGNWNDLSFWTVQVPTFPTVSSLIERLWSHPREQDPNRRASTWLNLAWTSLTAFFEIWDRSGRRLMLSQPDPGRVAAPLHDYLEGTRVISLGPMERSPSPGELLRAYWDRFVEAVQSKQPSLAGTVTQETLFSAFVEAIGAREGLPILAGVLELESDVGPWRESLHRFLDHTQTRGFRPRRLSRAVTRYHRWLLRNPTASWAARARTVNEIYETYGLDQLEGDFPETRLRVFRETVFSDARPELGGELDDLIVKVHNDGLGFDHLLGWITDLHRRLDLGEDELYFLARLAYGHLAPKEEAGWMFLDRGEGPQLELFVARRDDAGRQIWIRPPARPAEITRLHDFLTESGLFVHFLPEHDYLLLVDDNENVLGGLYYRELAPEVLHLEKLVVGEAHRGQRLGGDLLEEFSRQAASRGYRYLTTGFFRPDYFARFGFRTETGMAGLVKRLDKGGSSPSS